MSIPSGRLGTLDSASVFVVDAHCSATDPSFLRQSCPLD
jgi:hypothetical protein